MGRSKNIAEQLKQAVRDSEWSLNSIAKASGILQSGLYRFVDDERGLSLDAACRLAELLKMELTDPVDPDWSEYE